MRARSTTPSPTTSSTWRRTRTATAGSAGPASPARFRPPRSEFFRGPAAPGCIFGRSGGEGPLPDVWKESEAEYLAAIAENETRFYVGSLISVAGAFFLPIAALGLVHLVRVRKRVYGTVAGLVALVGAFGMPGAWLAGVIIEYMAAQEPNRAAMAGLLAEMEGGAATPMMIVWFGFAIGLLLVGIGLILARTVPRWMGAGVIVSVVALMMSEGAVGSMIAGVIIVAAWGAIAVRIWKRSPAGFENGELSSAGTPAAAAQPAAAPA